MTQPANVPRGAGLTALGVAQARVVESRRPDALFHDPLADKFIAAAGTSLWAAQRQQASPEAMRGWVSFADSVAVRTRFFDDYFREASTGGCRQIGVLGAGLDARAFRLAWAEGTRFFEVDTPDVIAFKEQVIARSAVRPRCERIPVAADLREDWPSAVRRAGFHPDEQTAWLAGGLLIYLTQDDTDRLMEDLSDLSAGSSYLALEHISQAQLEAMRSQRHGVWTDFSEMWQSGLAEEPTVWLARYGWQATVYDTVERAAAYGRPLRDAQAATSSWLISARHAGGQTVR